MPIASTSSKKRQASATNPGAAVVIYKGPSRLPKSQSQLDLYTTQINNAGTLSSSAGGVLNTVFDWYSQSSTPTDWASFANLYTEYRILSMEIEFIPWNKYNQPTTSAMPPVYFVVDKSNNTVLGSIAQAIAYDSCKVESSQEKLKMSVKMSSVEESQFVAIGSSPATSARSYIKMYGSGFAASANVYDFVCRCVVQFRGRQ